MIRVLLIDDHPMFRLGVAAFLGGSGEVTVVGEADDGISGLRLADATDWQVALVDISMPRLGGVQVVRRLTADYPDRALVVVSHFPEDPFEARVLAEGAAAFVSKGAPPDALLAAVRAAAAGERRPRQAVERPTQAHEQLTAREYQVFLCIITGRSTVDTAAELNISASTVSNHIARIKEKLNVENRGAIITYAHRVGLME